MAHSDVAVIIPSRIGSTRLPSKALAMIGDKTMIEHVINRLYGLLKARLYVATDHEDIAAAAEKAGAVAIMTDPQCPTGSDRVFQAYQKLPAKEQINYVINVQGDMPFIKHDAIADIIELLKKNQHDIVTSCVSVGEDVAKIESNVKVVVDKNNNALYFSRSLIPHGAKDFLYHVGIYGFTVKALTQFIDLEQSNYEKCEQLEQLRALENGMKIGICISNEIPISVDTPDDLKKAAMYYDSQYNKTTRL